MTNVVVVGGGYIPEKEILAKENVKLVIAHDENVPADILQYLVKQPIDVLYINTYDILDIAYVMGCYSTLDEIAIHSGDEKLSALCGRFHDRKVLSGDPGAPRQENKKHEPEQQKPVNKDGGSPTFEQQRNDRNDDRGQKKNEKPQEEEYVFEDNGGSKLPTRDEVAAALGEAGFSRKYTQTIFDAIKETEGGISMKATIKMKLGEFGVDGDTQQGIAEAMQKKFGNLA